MGKFEIFEIKINIEENAVVGKLAATWYLANRTGIKTV